MGPEGMERKRESPKGQGRPSFLRCWAITWIWTWIFVTCGAQGQQGPRPSQCSPRVHRTESLRGPREVEGLFQDRCWNNLTTRPEGAQPETQDLPEIGPTTSCITTERRTMGTIQTVHARSPTERETALRRRKSRAGKGYCYYTGRFRSSLTWRSQDRQGRGTYGGLRHRIHGRSSQEGQRGDETYTGDTGPHAADASRATTSCTTSARDAATNELHGQHDCSASTQLTYEDHPSYAHGFDTTTGDTRTTQQEEEPYGTIRQAQPKWSNAVGTLCQKGGTSCRGLQRRRISQWPRRVWTRLEPTAKDKLWDFQHEMYLHYGAVDDTMQGSNWYHQSKGILSFSFYPKSTILVATYTMRSLDHQYYVTDGAYYQEAVENEGKYSDIQTYADFHLHTHGEQDGQPDAHHNSNFGDAERTDHASHQNHLSLLQGKISLFTMTVALAWEENFFQDMMDRRHALALATGPNNVQTWRWARTQAHLPNPRESSRLQIFRSIYPIFQHPKWFQLHLDQHTPPIDAVTRIGRAWNDLRPTDGTHIYWTLHLVDHRVHTSPSILPGHSIQVLLSRREEDNIGNCAIVLVDIHDLSFDPIKTEIHATHVDRMQNRNTLLYETGYHDKCATTHICRTWRNGAPVKLLTTAWETADYILLQLQQRTVYDVGRTSDVGPAPEAGITTPETPEVTSPCADHDTESGPDENPESDYLVLIRRPRIDQPTDLLHVYIGDRDHEEAAAQARDEWYDLGPLEPTIVAVHQSFYKDFPYDPAWHVTIAVDGALFGQLQHMRAVIMMLRRSTHRDFQAVALAHLTSELGILSWCNMLRPCKHSPEYRCVVQHNGIQIHGATRVTVSHGDYIRVEILQTAEPNEQATLLSTEDGFEAISERRAFWPQWNLQLRIKSKSAPTEGALDRPPKRPRQSMHEAYWFTLTIFLWILTPAILCIYEREHPTPKPRRRRSVNAGHARKVVKTLALSLLLLSQHGHGVWALQHGPIQDLHLHKQFDDTVSQHRNLPTTHRYEWPVSPVQGLPPPGNPQESLETGIKITEQGVYLLQRVIQHVEYTTTARATRDKLLQIARPLRRYMQTADSSADLPERHPINLQRTLQFDPVKQTIALAEILTEDDCTVHASKHVSPLSPVAATQSPIEIVMPQFAGNPEHQGASPETFHMPDRDPPTQDVSSCKFPFRDRDTEDLLDEWPTLPFVELPRDPGYNTEVLKVLELPFVHADDDQDLYVYTDGSYDKKTQTSSWAFVVFAIQQQQILVRDWFADFVVYDPMDSMWVGALQVGIRSAEATALIYAILYTMQRYKAENITIYSDALSLVRSTLGQWKLQDDDRIGLNLRATFLAAKILRKSQLFQVLHVRSHCGIAGNEFADFLAVGVREGRISPRGIPKSFEFWFKDVDPHIRHVWLVFDNVHRHESSMQIANDQMTWGAPSTSKDYDWLPCKPIRDKPSQTAAFELSFTCVQFNVCTLRRAGAVAYMREQLEHHSIHIAGFQETRTPEPDTYDTNFIRLVAPAIGGQGGTEIWISRTLPIGKRDGEPLRVTRSDLLVLHATSEILLVVLTIAGIEILLASAHAPHKAHPAEDITTWWSRFHHLLQLRSRSRKVILLIDANAKVGHADPWTGDILDDYFDLAGEKLLNLCQGLSLRIPSTFSSTHYGSSSTWQSFDLRGGETRIDYICASSDRNIHCTSTWSSNVLDPGHSKADHIPLFGNFVLTEQASFQTCNMPKFDREHIAQATPQEWQLFFEDWPTIPWHISPTEHAGILEKHLHDRLQAVFPHRPQHRRDSNFSGATWEIYSQRRQLRKELKYMKAAFDDHLKKYAWDSIRGLSITLLKPFACAMRGAGRYKRLGTLTSKLHQQLLRDRLDRIDHATHDIQQCRPKDVARYLRPLRIGKRQRTIGQRQLPMINLEDGTPAKTQQESRDRWRRHFSQMEAGEISSMQALYEEHLDSYGRAALDFTDIPSIYEVEHQFRSSKPRKSMGFDFLPGELLRGAPSELAYAYYPLVQKVAAWQIEPLQFKGGKLTTLFKKGSPMEAENFRAILVSSSLGKAIHNLWRKKTLPWMRAVADPSQISAAPGALVAQAAHMVRLHMGSGKQRGVSCFSLFLDIQSAYYRLLRQHAMDLDCSDLGIMTLMQRLGLQDLCLDDVATALAEPSTLSQIGCPAHLHSMVSLFHEQTWYIQTDDDQLIATHRGTRPGDGFADLVWNLVYARFLHRVTARLEATRAYHPLPWNGLCGLLAAKGDRMVQGFATTWADDTAVLGWTSQAMDMIPTLQTTAEIIYEELTKLGMRPNTKPGKTEAIVDIRGPKSVSCRQHLHHGLQGRLPLRVSDPTLDSLRVVPCYNHLGGFLVHGSRHLTEIKRRIAMTLSAMQAHRSKVFANPNVDLTRRVSIFRTTAMMTLTYNIGTWLQLTDTEQKAWNSGVLKVYRKLLMKLFPASVQFSFEDGHVLAMTGLPHPHDLLHQERLRHFGLVLQRHNDFYWALVANEGMWLQQARSSFTWLYDQLKTITNMPEPSESPEAWHMCILQTPSRWKGILKRALAHATGQREIATHVRLFHKDFFQLLETHGLTLPDPSTPDKQDAHTCLICTKTFPTYRAWAVHSFDRHQRLSRFRQLDSGTICKACGRDFTTNSRLVIHFRSNPKCASTLAAQRLWPEPEPFMGSLQVRSTLLTDSMKPWKPSGESKLPPKSGSAMNAIHFDFMKLMAKFDWDTLLDSSVATEALHDFVHSKPLHVSEVRETFQSFLHYHSSEHARDLLQNTLQQVIGWYDTPESERLHLQRDHDLRHLHLIDSPEDHNYGHLTFSPRKSPKMLYVLHLFSGVKRDQDFHSCVDAISQRFSGIMCPISVDIALHPVHGDLLRYKTQTFWLRCAQEGKIFFVLCGPPCESWSKARMRFLTDNAGPRPIRDAASQSLLWGKEQLTLRELRQISFANRLLQFALAMMVRQMVTGNFGLLEHPKLPEMHQHVQPPSIWLLACMRILLGHPHARLLELFQGHYHGKAPKPTTLLCIADPLHGDLMAEALVHSRTRCDLPPALRMGKLSKGVYATNPLKRYPPDFCAALAKMVGVCVSTDRIDALTPHEDDYISTIAHALQDGYETVKDATHEGDAADFHAGCGRDDGTFTNGRARSILEIPTVVPSCVSSHLFLNKGGPDLQN